MQDLPDLDEVMNRVNAAMCRDTLESEFATVFQAIAHGATGHLAPAAGADGESTDDHTTGERASRPRGSAADVVLEPLPSERGRRGGK